MKKPNAMKPIVVDDDFLVEPVLHDARLYRMDFGGKRVAFYFADTSGQHIKLELHDVVQMSSHGLAEANIIIVGVLLLIAQQRFLGRVYFRARTTRPTTISS